MVKKMTFAVCIQFRSSPGWSSPCTLWHDYKVSVSNYWRKNNFVTKFLKKRKTSWCSQLNLKFLAVFDMNSFKLISLSQMHMYDNKTSHNSWDITDHIWKKKDGLEVGLLMLHHPCKHAITCRNLARSGPMPVAFAPLLVRLRHVMAYLLGHHTCTAPHPPHLNTPNCSINVKMDIVQIEQIKLHHHLNILALVWLIVLAFSSKIFG